jgi:hypothetical protein
MHTIAAQFHQQITPEMIDFSMTFAKSITVFCFGGLLLLSQIWIIFRYLRLAPAIEREASVPPVLQ